MTKEFQTTGMIIKETKVGEGNKIFTILTADLGKICASGAGVRSYKSKISGGCSLFCYSRFLLRKGRSKDILNIVSAEKEMDFFELRYDIEKLALVNYICDIANRVTVMHGDCREILRLLLNTVYYTQKSEYSPKIKPVFELRLMCEAGFAPNLECCESCGSTENLRFFSADTSGVLCSDCKSVGNITPSALDAMRYITSAPQKSIFSFDTDSETLSILEKTAEQYMLRNIGYMPKSLNYLKSLH